MTATKHARIAVVDYGLSNMASVVNALRVAGASPTVVHRPEELDAIDGIVVPGVGAFGDGMRRLESLGFVDALHAQVIQRQKPYLGICLGMQFLAANSLEHGYSRGLGWLDATVRLLQPSARSFKVPHMGWNSLDSVRTSPLFDEIAHDSAFYFVHSHHLEVGERDRQCVTATCWHGTAVTAAIQRDHIFGVQFHPEKSQQDGIRLLANYCAFVAAQC